MKVLPETYHRKMSRSDGLKPNRGEFSTSYYVLGIHNFPTEENKGSFQGEPCSVTSGILQGFQGESCSCFQATMHWRKGNTQIIHELDPGSDFILLFGELPEMLL